MRVLRGILGILWDTLFFVFIYALFLVIEAVFAVVRLAILPFTVFKSLLRYMATGRKQFLHLSDQPSLTDASLGYLERARLLWLLERIARSEASAGDTDEDMDGGPGEQIEIPGTRHNTPSQKDKKPDGRGKKRKKR
ncbi:MAG: hypothetical protein ABIJ56_17970 [Pseudomonadota bacterium]